MEKKGVKKMKLGSQGMEVSALGLGCMGMSQSYGTPKSDDYLITLIRHSIHLGVTFLDSADFYGPYTNEILLGKALKGGYREKVQVATKFGLCLVDGKVEIRGDAGYVRMACEASLKRLGIDCIDLYYQHRVDTRVPIEVTVGEMKKLVEEGKVKYIGLSEACPSTIRRAHAVHPLTALQLEWSLWTRELEEEIVPTCRELGIGIVAYGPLGKGFFTGGLKLANLLQPNDYRKSVPRFQEGNVEENDALFKTVSKIAELKGCTPSQLALAWVHGRGVDVCPIPGTTRIENLEENLESIATLDHITAEDMATLDSIAASAKGERTAICFPTWKNSNTPPPPCE